MRNYRSLYLGACLFVMVGFIVPQAWGSSFTLKNVLKGPNKWEYEVKLSDGEWLSNVDKLIIEFGVAVSSVSDPTSPTNLKWKNSGPGKTVTWEVTQGMTSPLKDITVGKFDVTSDSPSGTVKWKTNMLGGGIYYQGTTVGPVPIPEPATILLLGAGLFCVIGFIRIKFKE